MGSLRFLKTLEERDELVTAVLGFYTEGRVHAPLQQFREGLSVFGALAAMEEHCDVLAPVFLADQKVLCASDLVTLFVTRSFSLAGSNRKRAELKTIAYWRDWLLQVEDGASPLSLGDVLIFSTGLDKIPAMGFPTQPELEFLHPEDGPAMFPMANTCGPVLRLPVQPTFPKFESAMDMGIGGAIQFGIQ
ncbi:G2/M phase-specific E3 ubiquitin-protein ligase-like [Scophthalmus maximus]|uniref:G2/M phase-specific E3 ubiquitin-protein ligase-like n=1 Tax=Scophthalmus maximus TaxID=52904 RepID=UPI0015E0964D|nr:G2/M phase-specific E3 ubiquitin-protein ligase-like [Scophthalmus maximus]